MRHPLLHTILLAIAGCGQRLEGQACMLVPADGVCPDAADVRPGDVGDPWDCDNRVVRILGQGVPDPAPTFQTGEDGCCYQAILVDDPFGECIVGRPYLCDGAGVTAPASHAGAWVDIARAEHASIAAFARLQLDLMALGAPLYLLQEVAEALHDEVRHTAQVLAIASQLAEQTVSLGPFPFPDPVHPENDLAAMAHAAVREGCIGETLSALATRRAADACENPAHAEVLRAIADDEDRHAALSWRLVAWALDAGGREVRQAVIEAFQTPISPVHLPLLDDAVLAEVARGGLREVIEPAANALLA